MPIHPDIQLTDFERLVWRTAARLTVRHYARVSVSAVADHLQSDMWRTAAALRELTERGYLIRHKHSRKTYVYSLFVYPTGFVNT